VLRRGVAGWDGMGWDGVCSAVLLGYILAWELLHASKGARVHVLARAPDLLN